MSDKEELPPALAWAVYAIVIWVAIKGIVNWFVKNEAVIMSALITLAKGLLILGVIALIIYTLTRAVMAAWNWVVCEV